MTRTGKVLSGAFVVISIVTGHAKAEDTQALMSGIAKDILNTETQILLELRNSSLKQDITNKLLSSIRDRQDLILAEMKATPAGKKTPYAVSMFCSQIYPNTCPPQLEEQCKTLGYSGFTVNSQVGDRLSAQCHD